MAGRNPKTNQAVAVLPGGKIATIRGRSDTYPSRPAVVSWEAWEKECRVMAGAKTDFQIDFDKTFFWTDTLTPLKDDYGGGEDLIQALNFWLTGDSRFFTEKGHAMALLYVRMLDED